MVVFSDVDVISPRGGRGILGVTGGRGPREGLLLPGLAISTLSFGELLGLEFEVLLEFSFINTSSSDFSASLSYFSVPVFRLMYEEDCFLDLDSTSISSPDEPASRFLFLL